MTTAAARPVFTEQWAAANRAAIDRELHRLRLLLKRRVLWLRTQWGPEDAGEYQGLLIRDAQADRLLAGEDRTAESEFYRRDESAAQITRGIAELERRQALERGRLASAGSLPAIDVLQRLFDLNDAERDILLLAFAPHADAGFARLYAYAQDDATIPHATPQLALDLFGEGERRDAILEAFQPHAALRRHRLLEADASHQPMRLRMPERIASYLFGFNRMDDRVRDFLRPMSAVPLPPAHAALARQLRDWVQRSPADAPWPAVNLAGPPGSGRRAVAAELCRGLGMRGHVLDARRLGANPDAVEIVQVLEREAALLQAAFYIEVSRDEAGAMPVPDSLNALLIVGTVAPWTCDRVTITVRLAPPEAPERKDLWRRSLPDAAEEAIDSVVEQFALGPSGIARACELARRQADFHGQPEPGRRELRQSCADSAAGFPDSLAQRLTPAYGWDDIVVPPAVERRLRQIAAQVAHRRRVYGDWRFGEKLNRGRGISALFSGPSGAGKTMAADVLARELNLELYRVDLAGVVSKYVGETEKNLRRVFDAAEQTGAILFFDEADALFGKRSEVKDSHDRYSNIEVNYLLQRMEDYRGLAILATNMKSFLDQAFLRRLRFLVEFPFPDFQERRAIWQKTFAPGAPLDSLDYDALGRLPIAGGNIRNIALNAAFLAAAEGTAIGMNHVMRAAAGEYAKMDKLLTESDFGPWFSEVQG